MRTLGAIVTVLFALALSFALPAAAQEEPSGTSYVTPFPEADIYKLQAFGDVFAEGVLSGLVDAFAGDPRVQAARKHRALSGIARLEFDDEFRAEEESRETVHIGVVMIGFADRFGLRLATGKRAAVGTPEWREEYGRRVDRFIKMLKKRNIAVYWIGLPIMRRSDVNDDAQVINEVVRDKAYLNGIKYIDIQAQFADEAGNYAPYGPDLTGKNRLLREGDGIQFTQAGNRKLAHFVEQEIRRDINQAKNERSIPLAGAEAEQKRISAARPPRPAPEPDGSWRSTITHLKDGSPVPAAKVPVAPVVESSAGGEKADNGRITLKSVGANGREDSVTLDLPRPAIASQVIALVTRKESADRPSQVGDAIPDDVGGGLVLLNSITPSIGGPGVKRSAPSQAAYYQVLIKGERQQPKPGRADDFTWPRPEPEIVPEPPRRQPPARPAAQKSLPPRS